MPRLLGLTLGTGIPQDPASSLGGLALPAQPAWISSLTALLRVAFIVGVLLWCLTRSSVSLFLSPAPVTRSLSGSTVGRSFLFQPLSFSPYPCSLQGFPACVFSPSLSVSRGVCLSREVRSVFRCAPRLPGAHPVSVSPQVLSP